MFWVLINLFLSIKWLIRSRNVWFLAQHKLTLFLAWPSEAKAIINIRASLPEERQLLWLHSVDEVLAPHLYEVDQLVLFHHHAHDAPSVGWQALLVGQLLFLDFRENLSKNLAGDAIWICENSVPVFLWDLIKEDFFVNLETLDNPVSLLCRLILGQSLRWEYDGIRNQLVELARCDKLLALLL